MKTYKLPRVITGIYLLVVIFALFATLMSQATFSGIYLVILASPWAMPLISLLDSINPQLLDQGVGVIALLIGCAANAVVLYKMASWATWKFTKAPGLH